jgi:hypothetical protein
MRGYGFTVNNVGFAYGCNVETQTVSFLTTLPWSPKKHHRSRRSQMDPCCSARCGNTMRGAIASKKANPDVGTVR